MAQGTLHVDIISPAKPVYSGDASGLVAPAYDGEMGILSHHAPMVAKLGVGEIRITRDTLAGPVTDYFAIHKGFLQTNANKVIVITEEAKGPDDVNELAVKDQIEATLNALKVRMSPEERDTMTEKLNWLQAQARVARHSRKGMGGSGALERSGLTMTMDRAEMEKRSKTGG